MARKMTKSETLDQIARRYPEHNFIANVILVQHKNPARKLNGLLSLLVMGHDVRIAQFDIDRIVVNGQPWSWIELECDDAYLRTQAEKSRLETAQETGVGLDGAPQPVVSSPQSSVRKMAKCSGINSKGKPCHSPAVGPAWKGINNHTLPEHVDPAKCAAHQNWLEGSLLELALIDAQPQPVVAALDPHSHASAPALPADTAAEIVRLARKGMDAEQIAAEMNGRPFGGQWDLDVEQVQRELDRLEEQMEEASRG